MKRSVLVLLVTLSSSIAFAEKPSPPTMPPVPAPEDQCRPAIQKCLEIQENRKMKLCIKEVFQSSCKIQR